MFDESSTALPTSFASDSDIVAVSDLAGLNSLASSSLIVGVSAFTNAVAKA